jgi:uncharacterized Fe-S cluster protein YjdI
MSELRQEGRPGTDRSRWAEEWRREHRHQPDVERVYAGAGFVVTWEPKLCIHSGLCFRQLPRVFRPWARPWVDVDAADVDRIADVVATCPSAALKFERTGQPDDGDPADGDA